LTKFFVGGGFTKLRLSTVIASPVSHSLSIPCAKYPNIPALTVYRQQYTTGLINFLTDVLKLDIVHA
jgi:hypothetical protein